MRVFQTNDDGFFLFETTADPDPLVSGNHLIPRGCVTIKPPSCGPDEVPRWNGSGWETVRIYRSLAYRLGRLIRSIFRRRHGPRRCA